MLKVMEEKALKKPCGKGKPGEDPWFLYILECSDGSFYTGIAKNPEKRLKMHQSGKAARFTRARLPVRMLYQEPCAGRTAALVRECAVKALPRKKKEALIAGV